MLKYITFCRHVKHKLYNSMGSFLSYKHLIPTNTYIQDVVYTKNIIHSICWKSSSLSTVCQYSTFCLGHCLLKDIKLILTPCMLPERRSVSSSLLPSQLRATWEFKVSVWKRWTVFFPRSYPFPHNLYCSVVSIMGCCFAFLCTLWSV